ncbi:MAG: class I SAM-dependent methyltransferase [Calothrix sp. MO_192.B10]|nr:class I SAM-dependent methyltransferase [Calothrix sp. MO_192.B10]
MTNNFVKNKQKLFDRWAPSYDWLFPSVIYQAIHQRLLEYVNLPPKSNVLDMGCGTGRLLNRLAAQFPDLRGTGLDLSPQMLRIARYNNCHHPRLIYIQGQADSLPFAEAQFDAVFSTISFLHYLEPERVIGEVARVLKQDGRFYLVDITCPKYVEPYLQILHKTSNSTSIRLYSPESRQELGNSAHLQWVADYSLLGPVLLSVFSK